MNDQAKVWISSRTYKGRRQYHLRWIDGTVGRWRSKSVGGDRKKAEREAAKLESELDAGTYKSVKRATWAEFVDDHVAKISGTDNAKEARRTLDEFGTMFQPASPKRVTYTMIEAYVSKLREPHDDKPANSTATVNKKLRYIRAAMNRAVKRGYAASNPMDAGLFRTEETTPPRILDDAEQAAILKAAKKLYGLRWRAFVFVALNTGGRREELLTLAWDRVTLDGDEPQVHFTQTKSHRDRIVEINADVVAELRKLKAKTQTDGGPFMGMGCNVGRQWGRIIKDAKVAGVSIHDLRRTFVTRLIRAGVPLPHVQALAGHAEIKTTLTYYNWVSPADRRDAVARLYKAAAG